MKYNFEHLGDLHGFQSVDFFEQFDWKDYSFLTSEEIEFLVKAAPAAAAKPKRNYTLPVSAERRAALVEEKVEQVLGSKRTSAWDCTGMGPKEANKRLCQAFENGLDRETWLKMAREAAIMGRCPKSLKSLRSGLRSWVTFAHTVLGRKGREFHQRWTSCFSGAPSIEPRRPTAITLLT